MGTKFELEIAIKSIDIPKLLSCFKEYDFCKISSIDNWDYDNETQLSADTDINSILDEGRIIQIYSKNFQNGIFIRKEQNNYLCSLFFECTDTSVINYQNKAEYSKKVDFVIKYFSEYEILYAAFGCEMLISEENDILTKISSSHNVYMWLINKDISVKTQENYTQLERDNFTLFIKNQRRT